MNQAQGQAHTFGGCDGDKRGKRKLASQVRNKGCLGSADPQTQVSETGSSTSPDINSCVTSDKPLPSLGPFLLP